MAFERYQVFAYLGAIACGVLLANQAPGLVALLEVLVWPALALLLYTTFTQISLQALPAVMREHRFFLALVILNFLLLPALIWLLSRWLITEPVLLLGVFLVLLVPCTDWFVAFTHLGRGDARLAVAATPLLLLVQLIALPLYLWLFLGSEWVEQVDISGLAAAFAGLVLMPLLLALGTQRLAAARPFLKDVLVALDRLPIPLLALVLFLVAGSQTTRFTELPAGLGTVGVVFVLYLLFSALLATFLARVMHLGVTQARTLVFSAGTRNSFVVLPLALALPEQWQAAVTVVVLQSLIELLGMVFYIRLVPSWLIPGPAPESE